MLHRTASIVGVVFCAAALHAFAEDAGALFRWIDAVFGTEASYGLLAIWSALCLIVMWPSQHS